jgi:hypothetical protein
MRIITHVGQQVVTGPFIYFFAGHWSDSHWNQFFRKHFMQTTFCLSVEEDFPFFDAFKVKSANVSNFRQYWTMDRFKAWQYILFSVDFSVVYGYLVFVKMKDSDISCCSWRCQIQE